MSETHSAAEPPSFTEAEILRFQKDDLTAGKFIGRTLVLIFLYSVIVMAGVVWWTQNSLDERSESPTASASAADAKSK